MSNRFKMIPDYKVTISVRILAEVKDYAHQMLNIPEVWKTTRGRGVKVAILDTGLPKHNDLQPSGSASMIRGYLQDMNGHSTHCGGIIAAIANNGMGVAGIAPECEDFYCAVLDGSGEGDVDDIVKGIRWAVDEAGVDIINMSLGIPASAPYMPQLEAACQYAVSRGVTVIAAAGNEAWKVGQPAKYDCVIAVAAVDSKKQHADFSDSGPEVDFAAPGVDVYSTFLNNGYAKLSGTSMASPVLAGVAALVLSDAKINSNRKLTPAELKEKLTKVSYDVGPQGFDSLYGNGIPIFGQHPSDGPHSGPEKPGDKPKDKPKFKPFGLPQADCAIWRLVRSFAAGVKCAPANTTNAEVFGAGVRALADEIEKVDAELREKTQK